MPECPAEGLNRATETERSECVPSLRGDLPRTSQRHRARSRPVLLAPMLRRVRRRADDRDASTARPRQLQLPAWRHPRSGASSRERVPEAPSRKASRALGRPRGASTRRLSPAFRLRRLRPDASGGCAPRRLPEAARGALALPALSHHAAPGTASTRPRGGLAASGTAGLFLERSTWNTAGAMR